MNLKNAPYWDIKSLVVYLLMGLVGAGCIWWAHSRYNRSIRIYRYKVRAPYILLFFVWEIMATFRLVALHIGGADSLEYIKFFETRNSGEFHFYQDTTEPLFQLITKLIRFVTSDYHVYFFVLYAFMIIVYMVFFENFYVYRMSIIPQILLFFHFLRGLSSLRTNLATSFLLLSIVLYKKDKKWMALIVSGASVFIHRSLLIYSVFIVFIYLYSKKQFPLWKMFAFIIVSAFVGRIGQYLVLSGSIPFLQGKFLWYASRSVGNSFFDNFWKIAFSQMLLGGVLFILNEWLLKDISTRDDEETNRLKILRTACIFDIIMIPVCYILNIWRGYEFFYVIRLMMWGECIYVIKKHVKNKSVISVVMFILFISWMIFRIYNTYEDTSLMPYIFEPIYRLIYE